MSFDLDQEPVLELSCGDMVLKSLHLGSLQNHICYLFELRLRIRENNRNILSKLLMKCHF